MDEITKNAREAHANELSYADDSVERRDSWEEIEMKYAR